VDSKQRQAENDSEDGSYSGAGWKNQFKKAFPGPDFQNLRAAKKGSGACSRAKDILL